MKLDFNEIEVNFLEGGIIELLVNYKGLVSPNPLLSDAYPYFITGDIFIESFMLSSFLFIESSGLNLPSSFEIGIFCDFAFFN